MIYSVYILESLKDGNYYIGVTKDLNKRLNEHNNGLSRSTAFRRPFKLIYHEEFGDINSAYKRERFLKSKKSKKIINLIINSNKPR